MLFQRKKQRGMVSAIVAAGGSSQRMGENKLLMELYGIPVLARTLLTLDGCREIDEIILVCREEDMGDYLALTEDYSIQKIKTIAVGGKTRQQSVFAGVRAASEDAAYYCIHDGARPLAVSYTHLFQSPVNIPFGIPLGGVFPFVVEFFTLAQAQLQFHPGAFEIQGEGDQGIPLLFEQPQEPVDFPPVHQQFAGAHRIFIENIPFFIRADVHLFDKDLAIFDIAPAVFQVDRAGPQGFHLGAS